MNIKIVNIFKSFSSDCTRRRVLAGLSLEARPGEVVAVHGSNGAGKTTLLKIMAGLIVPDTGEMTLPSRQDTGLVADAERSFYQILSLRENIHFYASLFGIPRARSGPRMAELCARLGISGWLDTVAGHCSSGIRQRAAVARALIPGPSVLLIDELARSLDAESTENISQYLRELADTDKKTMIVVTHDTAWAKRYADTVWHLDAGIVKATPADIQ